MRPKQQQLDCGDIKERLCKSITYRDEPPPEQGDGEDAQQETAQAKQAAACEVADQ